MRIYSKLVWDIETGQLLEADYFDYRGEVASCKGASGQMKTAAAQEGQLATTLLSNYKAQFASQTHILDAINGAWAPIEAKGINQYGFSKAEDSALRTQASEGTAAAYKMAKQATGENLAAVGGGNTFLPSATKAGIMADTANRAAAMESSQQLGVTEKGYDVGRQNFLTSAEILSGVARMKDPTAYSSQVSAANQGEFEDYSEIEKMKQAASPWGAIGGAVGGLAGSFIPGVGTAIGSKLGSALGQGIGGS